MWLAERDDVGRMQSIVVILIKLCASVGNARNGECEIYFNIILSFTSPFFGCPNQNVVWAVGAHVSHTKLYPMVDKVQGTFVESCFSFGLREITSEAVEISACKVVCVCVCVLGHNESLRLAMRSARLLTNTRPT